MGEALEALKMETFWRENDKTEFENALQKLGILDVALTIKDSKMAQILMDEIKSDFDVKCFMEAVKAF